MFRSRHRVFFGLFPISLLIFVVGINAREMETIYLPLVLDIQPSPTPLPSPTPIPPHPGQPYISPQVHEIGWHYTRRMAGEIINDTDQHINIGVVGAHVYDRYTGTAIGTIGGDTLKSVIGPGEKVCFITDSIELGHRFVPPCNDFICPQVPGYDFDILTYVPVSPPLFDKNVQILSDRVYAGWQCKLEVEIINNDPVFPSYPSLIFHADDGTSDHLCKRLYPGKILPNETKKYEYILYSHCDGCKPCEEITYSLTLD